MNNLLKTMIYQMSRQTHTTLTKRHLEILEFAHEYYYKNRVGPLQHILKQKLGLSREELQSLFPNGIASLYSWVGIPVQSPQQICKPVAHLEVEDYREVYLDYNSTTYLREEVKKVLRDYTQDDLGYGNPSSSHRLGKQVYEQVFDARARLAGILKVAPAELVFTSGGTEADNLALKGIAFQHLEKKGHIISSETEHAAVLNTLNWLKEIGFEITLLPVTPEGFVSPESVKNAIRPDTLLVAIMAVNNEIGVINPLAEIGEICRKQGIPLMVDAVQAFGKIPLNPKRLGIALLSISGHKIYGPKGIGALFIDERLNLTPLIHGGEQESGIRSGTENVGHIVAFGKAAVCMEREREKEMKRLALLQKYFLEQLDAHVPGYIVNGTLNQRTPNNLNIGFPGIDGSALLLSLNQIGVFVSSGSACSAGSRETSHVIRALGVDDQKYGIIRFSFGLKTTQEDIEYLFRYLPEIIEQLKSQT